MIKKIFHDNLTTTTAVTIDNVIHVVNVSIIKYNKNMLVILPWKNSKIHIHDLHIYNTR